MASDFSLQFTKKNILFAFDSIECERSTSFAIPATQKNDQIFELAKWEAAAGSGMRRRVEAQMRDGLVTKDGFLYVDSYDYTKNQYNAIFLTGDLLTLKAIKDAGRISDLNMTLGDFVVWSNAQAVDADATGATGAYKIVKYLPNDSDTELRPTWLPSLRVSYIVQAALLAISQQSVQIPTIDGKYRLIQQKCNGLKSKNVVLGSVLENATPSSSPTSFMNSVTIGAGYPAISYDNTGTLLLTYRGANILYYKVRQYKALQTLKMTFDRNFDDDWFLVSLTEDEMLAQSWFLGGYSFDIVNDQVVASGEPLAGRTIEVASGTLFYFVRKSEFEYDTGPLGVQGFVFSTGPTFTITPKIQGEVSGGDVVMIDDNLPDCTIIDLLKSVANIDGKVLNYNDADGITFDGLLLSSADWTRVELDGKLIELQNMMRSFADYAQSNLVDFKQNENHADANRLRVTYSIPNDNITAEKVLQTIPFNEGDAGIYNNEDAAVFRTNGEDKNELPCWGIAKTGAKRLQRVGLLKNSTIQTLCTSSTSVQARVRMTLLEYDGVRQKTRFLLRGVEYVWTEMQWNKGVATIKMAKI